MGAGQRAPLFGRDFLLISITSFASFMAMQFLLPTLPFYLKSLGGQDSDIGLIFGAYSLSALGSRFVAGPMLDRWGRKRPLLLGVLLYIGCQFLYSATATVPSVILLRLLHGVGFGIVTTACSAMAADLAPPERRGEALGWYGNFSSLSMAVGPGIGLWLIALRDLPLAGFSLLFLACDALVVIELLFVLQIRGGDAPASRPRVAASGLRLGSIFCRDAVPMSIVMFFSACASGAIISFVPIYLSLEKVENVPLFFLIYATVMIASRPVIGKLADRVDRGLVVIPLMVLTGCGVGALAIAPSLAVAILTAVLFGIGYGALNPTLMALVVDVVKPRDRGAAMGTFWASLDLGIAVGSMVLGLVAQGYGYRWVFLVAAAIVFAGLGFWIVYCVRGGSPTALGRPAPWQ